jgi:hypothetical protein
MQNMGFEHDPDDAGDSFISHLIFLLFSYSKLLAGFLPIVHIFRRKPAPYSFRSLWPSMYPRQVLVLSCRWSVCRRKNHMILEPANKPNCPAKFSWRYIYSLDMIYCILVNCLLLIHGNDMYIACSVIVWPR